MHQRSYCEGVLAIEMKSTISSLSSTMVLYNISDYYGTKVVVFFFAMLVSLWTSLALTSSTLKTSVKF